MSWQRINRTGLRNIGIDVDASVYAVRVYSLNGKKWPRLVLTVQENCGRPLTEPAVEFDVSVARKDKPGAWWDSHGGIPIELMGELSEMLGEALAKISGSVPS